LHYVYVITRFATDANQRNVQLLGVKLPNSRIQMVAQRGGSRLGGPGILMIRQWPKPTAAIRFISRGLERRLDAFCFRASPLMLYVWPAARFLRRSIREHFKAGDQVTLVTCVPPHDLLQIGLTLAREFRELRWVIDWQDLWSRDQYYSNTDSQRLRRIQNTERAAATAANMNVVTNENAATTFQHVTGVKSGRVTAIPHAFSSVNIRNADLRLPSVSGKIKLGFLGNLIKPPKVPGEALLEAVDKIVQMDVSLSLTVIGDKTLNARPEQFQRRFPWLNIVPRMPHAHAVRMLSDFDALVLLLADLPNCRDIMHAKLPFYLAAARPIIGIVPDRSICARIIRECDAGWVISPADIASRLVKIIELVRDGGCHCPNNAQIRRYAWSHVEPLWIQALTPN
jgi:glycosyltransferase involved in cell wall biosynthesis